MAAVLPVPTLHPAAQAAAREQRRVAWTLLPAGALVAALLALPLAWLFALSFTGADGGITLANYARLFADGSFLRAFSLTLWLALVTTAVCGVAGYLLAYAMTLLPPRAAAVVLALVALPFWTSVLVRTYAWLVLLQNRGVLNSLLLKAGIIDTPLPLMHNATGALIAMVHIMLPFMVFPLYAALRKVDPDQVRAAASLGAAPTVVFWRVFFPQTLPGILAGCVLVFVLSLGFYITPALLGGGRTVVMSILIEHEVSASMAWGTAGAMALLFLALVLAVFAAAARFVPIDRLFQR